MSHATEKAKLYGTAAAIRDALAEVMAGETAAGAVYRPPVLNAASKLHFGAGAPSNALGANGDAYINTTAGTLYGPKAAGVWPGSPISLGGSGSITIASVTGLQAALDAKAATTDLTAHAADSTAIHGISDTAKLKGVVIWDGVTGSQPARPAGFASVEFIQPSDPSAVMLNGDTWTPTA